MISNYEIKLENNEEILYLYFDFNDEFAKLNGKDKKQKLKDTIKKFIKENKIIFNGTKVAIITGGLFVGTLLLNKPNISVNTPDFQDYAVTISENAISPEIDEEKNIAENKEETIEITVDNKVVTEVEEKQNNISTVINNSSNSAITIKENPAIIKKEEPIQEEAKAKEESKIYVTIHRTNGKVLNIELEEYIIGVVGAEMPASFQSDALMAQAIIARTYALKALNNNITLTDNSSTQNYKSNDELKSMWGSSYNTYYTKIKNAVEKTKGIYLTYNGTIIEAVYHSTSNGQTEDAQNVWGNSFPYLVSVASPYDSSNPSFIKEQLISYQDLSTKLSMEITIDSTFNIISRTSGNRVEKVSINNEIFTGIQIRNLLGLRSADFETENTEEGIKFITKGYGHGVGMSQYGANGMSKNGYDYEQILKHYYPGVTLSQM